MSTTHDILHLKTEAELRFFVENPAYYHAELVAAAQRELRRRGPSTAPVPLPSPVAEATPLGTPTPTASYVASAEPLVTHDYAAPEPAPRPWLLLSSVAAVCFVAGLGFWLKAPTTAPGAPAQSQELPAGAPAAAPRPLETAPSAALPTFDTQGYVEKALAQVPAAELHNEQLVSQYRAVSLRFWAAQNPAAHLLQQAQEGRANPVFGPQAKLVLGLWHDFDRTQVYSYSFGPVMADHLARMKVIANYQRDALKELANDAEAERPPQIDDAQTLAHQQTIPHLLAPLTHKVGPITVPL